MAVRIRMKKLGRRHRPYFRICAVDGRAPRDGRVLEELGTYDPMIHDTDARVTLNTERVDYWLGVGAQPSEKVAVLIKKYGTDGTHAAVAQEAAAKRAQPRVVPPPPEPVFVVTKEEPKAAEAPAEAAPAEAAPAAEAAAEAQAEAETAPEEPAAEAPAEEAPAAEADPAPEAAAEEDAEKTDG